MSKNSRYLRFWEIDFFRGIVILMMIIYHILYNIYFFDIYSFNIHSLPFRIFLFPIGTTFLFLVGISLTLSYNKAKKNLSKKRLYLKFFLRGIKIFSLGLVITFFTWIFLEEGFVIFGILHCIGISIILSVFFIRFRFLNLIFGSILFLIGFILRSFTFDFNYLLFLGFIPRNFYTVDYFPLLPWFGVVLFGIGFGNILYPNYKRVFILPDLSDVKIIKFLCFLGRNSLIIYFLHQILIIGLIQLYLIF